METHTMNNSNQQEYLTDTLDRIHMLMWEDELGRENIRDMIQEVNYFDEILYGDSDDDEEYYYIYE